MKQLCGALLLLSLAAVSLEAQSSITPYYSRNDFLLASPGAMKFGLYGYDNPALLSYVRQPDLLFTWSDANGKWNDFNRWGLFLGAPDFGFGIVHNRIVAGTVTDYTLSLASGNRSYSAGISYNWSTTSNPALDKSSLLTLGALSRPVPYVSVAAEYTNALNVKGYEVVGEIAARPLGTEFVTAFADYVIHRTPQLNQDNWSTGVAFEALPGVRITGRYFDTKAFTVGLQFSLGQAGVESQAHYDASGNHSYNTYGIRLGAYDRNVLNKIIPHDQKYVAVDLNGPIDYQRYEWFDNTKTLSGVLSMIDAAKVDPSVAGIAINTSGMETNREKLWELREKLKDFKSTGKKVIIFIDRGDLDLYHFASIADKVVMDPLGMLILQGYVMGRTYLKGTLEKIGVGYDEWRFFKYKSANESSSRTNMSDADREQRQKIVDDWYSITKTDICDVRHLSSQQFDKIVNEDLLFSASQAKEFGLIDSTGRWDVVKEIVKVETQKEDGFKSVESIARFHEPYDAHWSEPPHIAVIYVLGVCAMDEGITARKLVKDVQAAVDNDNIKAIVLRIDSPGGDAVASDYIAEVMKKAKGKKPIIVSQGFVAASGGYWLSMYADTIVAAPGTITGSIGVIGGWLYNKSLKETLGISTDLVKAGAHGDLGFGFQLPLIGLGLPDRNLTDVERARAEGSIRTYYKEFVSKVSLGRKKSFDEIDNIAQGRVWSGLDGKQKGLVDIIGGLETAIAVAKDRSGIPQQQEVIIEEMPKKGLFNFASLQPKLFGIDAKIASDPTIDILKLWLQHNGEPMPILPLEDWNLFQPIQ